MTQCGVTFSQTAEFASASFQPELGGRALRVITLADGMTIHNAFLDRRFTMERLDELRAGQ
jgi:hypothetical protein